MVFRAAGRDAERAHKQDHDRPVAGRPLYGAVFDALPAGEYTLWLDDRPLRHRVAVAGAAVTNLEIKEEHHDRFGQSHAPRASAPDRALPLRRQAAAGDRTLARDRDA